MRLNINDLLSLARILNYKDESTCILCIRIYKCRIKLK